MTIRPPVALGMVLLLAPSPASAQVVRTVGRVLVTAGVEGHFADPSCDGETTLVAADFARRAAVLETAAGQSDDPLILDAGNFLSPFGVARWAAAHDPDGLAELVQRLGYRALALGLLDLAAPRDDLVSVLAALRARGVPTIATNVRCAAPDDPLCENLVDGSDGLSVLRFGDRRAAVVSLLPTDASRGVGPDRLAGIRIVDPAEALGRAVRLARERSLFVVATIDLLASADPTGEALALVSRIPLDERPHLLIVSGAGGELSFARPADFRPALVGPPDGGVLEVRVRDNLLSDTFDMLAVPAEPTPYPALPVADWIDRTGSRYCAALGQPLPGGRLARPLDAVGFATLAASVVRDAVGVDVAVLPSRVVEPSWRPTSEETLSASDVYVALRYDQPLVRARVERAWLAQLEASAADRLLLVGVEGRGNDVRVHGRATIEGARYSVVTTQFVASQLRGLPGDVEWSPTGATLRGAVRRWLSRSRQADPRDAVRDPANGIAWTARADLDATFEGTEIQNTPGYDATQLSGASNLVFGGSARISIDAVAPLWAWENVIEARYNLQVTQTTSTNPTDLFRYLTSAAYRGLRGADSPFWVPELYVDNLFETEFTTPATDNPDAPDARGFHAIFTRPAAGLRFPLRPELDLQSGFSNQIQRVERVDGFGLETQPGINVRLTLRPWTLIADPRHGREVTWRFLLDANVASWFDVPSTQLRGETELRIALAGPLGLKLVYEVFAQKDRDQSWGLYARGVLALGVHWAGRTVTW